MNRPIPLRPDPSAIRSRGGTLLIRALCAKALSTVEECHVADIVRQHWSEQQKDLELVVRAASTPASTVAGNWAAQFVQTSLVDTLVQLAPQSAGLRVLNAGVVLEFGSSNVIAVPSIVAAASSVGFVAQGAALPVIQQSITGPQLTPHKLGVITTFTNEIAKHSTPSIEALMRLTLSEALAQQVDTVLFGTGAGDSTTPKGLLNGLSPSTPSTSPDAVEAMRADLGKLAGLVSAVSGDASIVIVASPTQAVSVRLWGGGNLVYPVFSSSVLASGTVIAIATNTVASAGDSGIRFDTSEQATLHADTAPAQISTVGTPNVVAAPTRSLWQTNSLGLRLLLEIDWCLRHSSGAAFMTGVNW